MKIEVDKSLLELLRAACESMTNSGPWTECPACGGAPVPTDASGALPFAYHKVDCKFRVGWATLTALLVEDGTKQAEEIRRTISYFMTELREIQNELGPENLPAAPKTLQALSDRLEKVSGMVRETCDEVLDLNEE